MQRSCVVWTVFAFVVSLAFAVPVRADTEGEIRAFLLSELARPQAPPSISVAVGVRGRIVLATAVGYADIGKKIPATPETQYRTYSVTKGITAIAIMQLLEQKRITLDDDIRTYVPAFPRKPWPVRLRHLLGHTSGIRHYREGAGEISSRKEYASLADAIGIFKDDPLQFEPGTAYGYTSFGFNLLQGVIESVSALAYGAYVRKEILEPAGMSHTALHTRDAVLPGLATPYVYGGFVWKKLMPIKDLSNVSSRYAAAGIVSTPSDLVRLFLALERGALMSDSTRTLMYACPFPRIRDTQACGWNRAETEDGDLVVYRTGDGIGYTGYVMHDPEAGVTGALLVNEAGFDRRLPVLARVLRPYLDAARAKEK